VNMPAGVVTAAPQLHLMKDVGAARSMMSRSRAGRVGPGLGGPRTCRGGL
jgi:hypothetical protein